MNKSICLDNLPKNKKGIIWKKSIGNSIKFIYDDIEGCITIVDYIKSTDNKHNKLLVEYNNIKYKISPESFKEVAFGKILNKKTNNFKIGIGDSFIDDTRNFTIITSEYRTKQVNQYTIQQKWYKYHCNLCNKERWDSESHILEGRSCTCYRKNLVIEGENDIPTTAPWMVPYFQNGYKDAKLYTKQSSKKIKPKCPYCGRIHYREIPIYSIYNCNGFKCPCSDKISYAEKFVINFLEQLQIEYEYQKPSKVLLGKGEYYYDFYIPKYNCIIETHGEQHYRTSCGFFQNNKHIISNDSIKKILALNNGIDNYIILDCRKSKLSWIKNSIISSNLYGLLELSKKNIDWSKCEKYAISNLIKEVCDFKNSHKEMTPEEISKHFPICRESVSKYLHIGHKYGWCYYEGKSKPIKVSKDEKFIGIYKNAEALTNASLKDFGVQFSKNRIWDSCRKNKLYKGFNLEYIAI